MLSLSRRTLKWYVTSLREVYNLYSYQALLKPMLDEYYCTDEQMLKNTKRKNYRNT